jgi:HEPN domain-containing protein
VRAVVRHIERAEMHFRRGREEADDDSFNDVVYRTNQAFELTVRSFLGRLLRIGTEPRVDIHREV